MKKLLYLALLISLLLAFLVPATQVYATAIDVGPAAINRTYSQGATYTMIDKTNPANETGVLDTVQIYAKTNITGLRVGTFYFVSGTTYRCRDSEAIAGTITSGSTQTITGLSINVTAGDYIGCYFTGGTLAYDSTGGVKWLYKSGEYIDPNDSIDYADGGAQVISLYATGATSNTTPTVTTQATSSIGYTTATGNGNITNTGGENCTHRGICYSSTSNPPTTSDSKVDESGSFSTGAFTESLTGLSSGTLYRARAYATNSAGTSYGDTVTFTTLTQAPTVTTSAASSVTMDKVGTTGGAFNGNLTNLGDDTDADVSFEYGPTTAYGSETTPENKNATGTFTATIPNSLTPGATYHYRSKAVNDYGPSYGSDQSFTFTMPTITTDTATYTSPGTAEAQLNGTISSLGVATGCTVYFEWGTSVSYGSTTDGQEFMGTVPFDADISGFLHNVTIHYRAVCEIDGVYSYGSDSTFLIAPNPLSEVLWYQPNAIILDSTANSIVDSGSTTTIVDSVLTQADDYWNYATLVITDTTDDTAPKGETAVISNFEASTDTLTFPALTAGVEAGDTYTLEFGILPDRATTDGYQDGIITWGTNPAGITIATGSMSNSDRAILDGYTAEGAGSILDSNPLAPPQLYTELDLSKIPGADIINAFLEEGDTPQALWWFPFIFGIIAVIGLLIYDATQRNGGEGSLLIMSIVIEVLLVLFGILGVAATSSAIPLWPAFTFPIPAIALILSKKHYGWG